MSFTYHHPDKWVNANLDLIEEMLETKAKAVVLVSGASSSGKSHCSRVLSAVLESTGYRACCLSLDDYNFGLSGIIPNKVNQNFFQGKLPHMEEIRKAIKEVIVDIPFEQKYDASALAKISPALDYWMSSQDKEIFLSALSEEWHRLNFDEPSVYDLDEAAMDIKALLANQSIEKKEYSKVVSERVPSGIRLNGQDYQVILVEGIYALNEKLVSHFRNDEIITNFIDSDPKTLFLRRIIRDMTQTSAPTPFTMSLYFRFIVPAYQKQILPNRAEADIVFHNDMTFLEMKSGTLYKNKLELHTFDKDVIDSLLKEGTLISQEYHKDTYLLVPGERSDVGNVLRLRCVSSDEGKTYQPSSLVHKGLPKVRKDNHNIRPIHVLLREGEFSLVWSDEAHCLKDFVSAGFILGPVYHKVKTKVTYHGQQLTLRSVEDKGYYIEFDAPVKDSVVKEIQEKLS